MADSLTGDRPWELDAVLELWVDTKARPVSVALAGELDAATAGHVREVLATVSGDGHRDVVVDLRRVVFVDGEGIGVLVHAARRARAAGGHIRLVAPNGSITSALHQTGLQELLATG
jgi:anti-anti-sigma factor